MSKYGEDLRRIVRYQELLDLINKKNGTADQATKGAIDGARGTAYGSGSNVTGTTTGTPGVTGPGGTGNRDNPVDVGTDDGEQAATDAAGDVLDDSKVENTDDLSDPDNSLRDGWYDLESVLDGAMDALGKYPPAPNSNVVINALTGITDSAATRALIIHFKEAANAFIAPSDRTSSNERVPEDDFEQGIYWSWFALNTPLPQEIIDAQIVSLNTSSPSLAPWTFVSYDTPLENVAIGGSTFTRFQGFPSGDGVGTISKQSCILTPPTSPYACPIIAPAALWADLGATQLAFQTSQSSSIAPFSTSKEGQFIPHPYDDNIPTEFVDGVSIIDAKTTSGDDVRIGPLYYGGWYAHYSTAGVPVGAATDNSVLIISANRTHGGFVTPNQLLRMLPPT